MQDGIKAAHTQQDFGVLSEAGGAFSVPPPDCGKGRPTIDRHRVGPSETIPTRGADLSVGPSETDAEIRDFVLGFAIPWGARIRTWECGIKFRKRTFDRWRMCEPMLNSPEHASTRQAAAAHIRQLSAPPGLLEPDPPCQLIQVRVFCRRCFGTVTTPQPADAARRPASSAGRCRPFAAPRARLVNGPPDSGQPQ
jgi:hypothetical protein